RDRARVATQNLAQLLESNLDASLQRADAALLTVKDEIAREADEGGVDRRTLGDFFERAFSHQVDVDSLQVADSNGNLLSAVGQASIEQDSVMEREFFTKLRDGPHSGIVFSRADFRKGSEEAGIVIARGIERHTGGFAGVVFAVLAPDRLHKVISGLELGSNGLVAIRGLDFGLLIRHPRLAGSDAASDPRTISGAFRQALFVNPDLGTFTSKNGFDGIERTNTYRKLAGYPYYVIVGLSTDDYLLGWRRESLTVLALAGCFALATFVLSEQLRRLWTRREAAIAMLAKQEARLRKLVEWAPDALVITDSNGLIVMVNQRTESMFGYSREELVGRSVEVLVPQRFRTGHADMLRRFSTQPETRKMGVGRPVSALSKDGREFPVNISLSPIETDEGVLITADIRDMRGMAR
ncbi:MAG TPA: PAS domain S-box protein, partial [Burkholderiaceae bacterium]|nr:PAS domain S-box protein [Burkholderiaceae bacterium]